MIAETATADVVDEGVSRRAPRPASPLNIIVDKWLARVARGLGYAPVDPERPTPPLTPVRTWLADALAALWRAADDNPANETPTVRPVHLHQFVTGEVLGDLRAGDADGDALTYTVLAGPATGTLTVNANGTYYYKPTSQFAESGGEVTFFVAVNDGNQAQTVAPVTVTVTPTLGLTQNFWFRNYTLAPLKLTGYQGGDTSDVDSAPPIGTIINPGAQYGWEITVYLFTKGSAVPQFGSVGFDSKPTDAGYLPDGVWGTIQPGFITRGGSNTTECASGGNIRCTILGTTVIAENPGRTIALSGGDAAKIASVLTNACLDNSDARCTFEAKTEVAGYSPTRVIGQPVKNSTTAPLTTSIQMSDTASQTDSVGISVKLSGGQLAKLAALINVEITGSFSHSWTRTYTFSQTIPITLQPGETGWVQGGAPVWRVTGDFTVKIGKSTYILNGATFDSPNPNGVTTYIACSDKGGNPACKLPS